MIAAPRTNSGICCLFLVGYCMVLATKSVPQTYSSVVILTEDLRSIWWWVFRFCDGVLSIFVRGCLLVSLSWELWLVILSGRYDVKSGCAFLCAGLLGRSCFVDVFAGSVLLRFLVAATTVSATLSRGDCLSRRKALSGMRDCMPIWGVIGGVRATSLSLSALGGSGAGDREKTGGDLVSSGLAGANKGIGVILFVGIDAVVRPTVGIGLKTLEGAGRKLRQPSCLSVPSMCLCASAMCWLGLKLLGLFLLGNLDVGGGSKSGFSRS